jgi:hypothetical protein
MSVGTEADRAPFPVAVLLTVPSPLALARSPVAVLPMPLAALPEPLALALAPVAVLLMLPSPPALAPVPHATELGPAAAPWPVPVCVSLQTNCAAAWDGANAGAAASAATKATLRNSPPESALVPSKARLHRTCAKLASALATPSRARKYGVE